MPESGCPAGVGVRLWPITGHLHACLPQSAGQSAAVGPARRWSPCCAAQLPTAVEHADDLAGLAMLAGAGP